MNNIATSTIRVPTGPQPESPGGRLSGRIFLWSLTSALAGFLFGFDTVVISGAEQKIQSLWGLGPGMHGIVMASALYGTVLGSLVGGWPTDRFGRKPTLLMIGVLYIISAAWSGLATDVASFVFAFRHFKRHLTECVTGSIPVNFADISDMTIYNYTVYFTILGFPFCNFFGRHFAHKGCFFFHD